ncbi:hypothetical protein [Nostoc sp. CALU 546]|uniref:hypothetical protein n=1 Tax=Nostoc sp. CALU 546 TaxID=1867241 RepID=UPI003B67D5C6
MTKITYHKDAINRRLYKELIIVKTAIYRVSCLNQTVLGDRTFAHNKTIPSMLFAYGDRNSTPTNFRRVPQTAGN